MATREFSDNPLRLTRLAAGLSMPQLAALSGVNKSTISMIEAGRTREPSEETLEALARHLPIPTSALRQELLKWRHRRTASPLLSVEARAALRLRPDQLREQFSSFRAWRELFAGTPTAFATMLGIHHTIPAEYERGVRATAGLPRGMQGPMMNVLGVDGEYLRALSELPPA